LKKKSASTVKGGYDDKFDQALDSDNEENRNQGNNGSLAE